MPYIPVPTREYLDTIAHKAKTLREFMTSADSPGKLNYIISTICDAYIGNFEANYKIFNEVIGALESAKLELYRRQIAHYEDVKAIVNGDVFTQKDY